MPSKSKQQVILIDGRNWCYRHGYTRIGLSSRGRPTGALFGAIQGLIRLNRMYPKAAIVFCWDGKKSDQSWRHRLCSTYKSNRVVKTGEVNPLVSAIRSQIPLIMSFLRMYGIKQFDVPKLEADDLIGILSTALKSDYEKVIIHSTDRDFYQLIKGNVLVVRDLDKKLHGLEFTAQDVKNEFGVYPKDWLKFRAFVGDKGDRIDKPIPGIGGVKALKILAAGVDASKKKPHPEYKEHWHKIRLAYKLSRILRKYDDPKLPKITQDALRTILMQSSKNLCRSKSITESKKAYKEMIKFLCEFELEELIAQSTVLWRIR